jgi:AcrR family transcriptional regulator
MPRTRSARAHRKVIDAALELVAERGIDETSMDAIADLSGVSKATIYKHWRDKDALLLEVMAEVNGLNTRPKFDSGDTRRDLIAVLAYRPKEHADTRERMMPHLISYSARKPAFGDAWRNLVMEPPRRELRGLISAGIRKRELTPTLDCELSLALLLGPMLYCHLFMQRTADSPRQLATAVVDAFWRAFGAARQRT